jgi:hypothetical protein
MGTKCFWASSISLLKKRQIRSRADKEKKEAGSSNLLGHKSG